MSIETLVRDAHAAISLGSQYRLGNGDKERPAGAP